MAAAGGFLRLAAAALLAGAALLAAGVSVSAASAASTWASVGGMRHARSGAATAVLLDGRVLVVGGARGAATAEIYDPKARSWSKAPDPPGGFEQEASAILLDNSRVLVVAPSGQFRAGAPPDVTTFDSELGWLSIPNPTGVGSSAFAVGPLDADNVLLAGGLGPGGPVASAALYSARANGWVPEPPLPSPRTGALAAPLGDGRLLVAGGAGFGGLQAAPLDDALIFDRTAGWLAAGSHPGLAHAYRLLPLGSGRVLALTAGPQPGMALYDAASNRWASVSPPFDQPGEAVLLRTGKVLVAGGFAEPRAGAALYDPAAGHWSDLQQLPQPLARPILVPLGDGGVLAAGGLTRSGPTSAAEVFGGPPAPVAATPTGLAEPGWIGAGAGLLALGLLGLLAGLRGGRGSRLLGGVGRLALQAGGVIVLTWALLDAAHLLVSLQEQSSLAVSGFFAQPLGQVLWEATARSLVLIAYAVLGASVAGLGAAIAVVSVRERRLVGLELAGAVLLVLPTFLLAILVQELQAQVYGRTGLVVAAGYGSVNAVQVFWAAVVLGIRPAIYLYRHGRAVLEREAGEDYVRTAEAKGLEWPAVVRRHLVRAGGSALVATWANSFRLMIGSLPLVEYFFGYPGLGRVLVQSIGIHFALKPAVVRGDIAIGLVVILALILILVETVAGGLQRWLDPRLRAVRSAA